MRRPSDVWRISESEEVDDESVCAISRHRNLRQKPNPRCSMPSSSTVTVALAMLSHQSEPASIDPQSSPPNTIRNAMPDLLDVESNTGSRKVPTTAERKPSAHSPGTTA